MFLVFEHWWGRRAGMIRPIPVVWRANCCYAAACSIFQNLGAGEKSVRKVKDGEVEANLFGLLTTEPNAEVGAIHPKAMPVILTRPKKLKPG